MKTALAIIALAIAGGLGAGYWAWQQLDQPLTVDDSGTVLVVPAGTTLKRVGQELEQRGVLKYPWLWTRFAEMTGQARSIKAGEYILPAAATPRTLLAQLVAGDVRLHSITLIEGWRFDEALAAIRAHPAIAAGEMTPDQIMGALGKPNLHPEGQLLPETYHFPRGTSDLTLLKQSHEALHALLDE